MWGSLVNERWSIPNMLLLGGALVAMAVCFSAAAVIGLSQGWPLLWLGPVLGYLLWRRVPPVSWMASIQHEFEQAAWFGDDSNAVKLADELMTELRRWTHAPWMADLLEAGCLSFQERYQQAADILSRLNTAAMNQASQTLTFNSLAWCKAHLGEAEEAVKLAREAVRRAEAGAERPVLALCRGTLGAALVLAGEAQEGVSMLEAAIEANRGRPAQLCCHAYYLAMAHWNLGRIEKAQECMQCAVAAAPNTRFGRLAVTSIRHMLKDDENAESAA